MIPHHSNHDFRDARRREATIVALTLLLAVAQGCTDTVDEPTLDALPLWSATPGSRIGSVDDPELAFGRVSDLEMGPDGRVYSLHSDEPSIRIWTTDGRPEGKLGRRGSGPGEFERPSTMAWKADSLAVLEQDGSRITFFATSGLFLAQITPRVDMISFTGDAAGGYASRPIGYLSDGSLLSRTLAPASEVVEGRLREVAFTRTAVDGSVLDTLALAPVGRETLLGVTMEGGGGTYSSQPYSDGIISEPAADLDGILLLDRKAANAAEVAEFRLSRVSLAGDTVFSRNYDYLPVQIDKAEVDSVVASMAESLHEFVGARTGTTVGQWTGWIDEAMYKPQYHPPVETMVPGWDGTIWLSRNPVAGGEREWLILSDEGEPLGRVRLPSAFRLMEAAESGVWGIERDDLDVEYIVSYEISKE